MQHSTILRSPISNTTKLEKYLKAEAATARLNEHSFPPPTAEKRLVEHDFDKEERKKYIFPPILRDKRSKAIRFSIQNSS